jgi:peptide/nickel transport system substrate-binding protein/oligopeptide transport system substrate-binding protein
MYNHEIQLMWVRWYIDYPDANNYQYQVWYSKTPTGRRHAWSNDEFDELVTEAKSLDPEGRADAYRRADEIMLADGAAIVVWYIYAYGLLKPWVSNVPVNSAGDFTPNWNIFIRDYDWYQILDH